VSTTAQAARTARAEAARTASVATSTAPGAAGATTTAARQRTSGGSSWLRWLIGLIVLLVLIWLAWQYLFRGQMEEAVAPTTPPATVGEPAQNLVVGDVNLGQEVTGAFESATAALNDVTDPASAEAALPRLTEINTNLDRLGGLVGQLPAEGKSALAALINGALPELEALIARVSEISGVGPVIKPAADALVAKLKAMAA
jgi:cytoskeletal protein RodZ